MGRLTAVVLGSAAGGGFPQWNCRCAACRLAWDGDDRVRPRTQTSLAVSGDSGSWAIVNASPDLRSQIIATSRAPVFPLVEGGVFRSELYYRLNTFLLDLRACP